MSTNAGWLEVYHGNNRQAGQPGVGTYSAGALLLHLDDPSCIRAQSGEILVPETDYEREGFVPNVVFPSGAVVRGESLLVYCGATDESCAIVEWRLLDLLDQFLDAGWRGAQ